jgi:hypothetical protein
VCMMIEGWIEGEKEVRGKHDYYSKGWDEGMDDTVLPDPKVTGGSERMSAVDGGPFPGQGAGGRQGTHPRQLV